MAAHLVPLLAALVVVGPAGMWRFSRTVVTIAHEGGHALTALLSGRRLAGIRLHTDSSGVTVSVGRPTGAGMVFTASAGYLAPSLLGLGAAGLLSIGWALPLLWVILVLLVVTLWYTRNLFGALAVLLTGAAVAAVAWYGWPGLQTGFTSAASWFLLLGGLRADRELGRVRRHQMRGGIRRLDSDADQLARLTGLPPWLWVGAFTLVGLGALGLGGWWLLGDLPLRLAGLARLSVAGVVGCSGRAC